MTFETSQRDKFQKSGKFHFLKEHEPCKKFNVYILVSVYKIEKIKTLELDTRQSFNVSLLQNHWVRISEAGLRTSR